MFLQFLKVFTPSFLSSLDLFECFLLVTFRGVGALFFNKVLLYSLA